MKTKTNSRRSAFALVLATAILCTFELAARPRKRPARPRPAPVTSPASARVADSVLQKSLVLVKISNAHYDYSRPWVKEVGQSYTVMGLVLANKRILVLGNDVRNAVLLEVRKYSSSKRHIARVSRIDMEVNLALLELDDPAFFQDLPGLAAGGDPRPGDSVTVVKMNDLYHVYRETATINEVSSAADFGFTHLPMLTLRTNENFMQGGLLLCRDKFCGFIGYSDRDRRAEAIPASIIEAFRERALIAQYPGFVAQGYWASAMEDPVLREYYQLPEKLTGPLVERVYPGTSAWGTLQKEDVLLALDGVKLDNRGYFEHPTLGRQEAYLLLAQDSKQRVRRPGETIGLSVFRKGKEMQLTMTLRAYAGGAERIPWLLNGGQPNYLVESGMVFLELSVPLLKRLYGGNWKTSSIELSYVYKTRRYYEKESDERIVILAYVLPDQINLGYDDLQTLPIESINGQPVKNLGGMRQTIVDQARQGDKIITLALPGGRKIYLDLENREKINARILQKYRIPQASLWD